jgi:hypothetical protein
VIRIEAFETLGGDSNEKPGGMGRGFESRIADLKYLKCLALAKATRSDEAEDPTRNVGAGGTRHVRLPGGREFHWWPG